MDWERETPAQLAIECVGCRRRRRARPARAAIAAQLRAAAPGSTERCASGTSGSTQIRAAHQPGRLVPARRYEGGADDILYGNDWFRLRDGEALVVTCDVPDARYWQFQLCDSWFRSLDYANHQTSLNAAQLRRDADGRVRIVVASRDPGVANWLDPTGLAEGVFQYRFIWARRRRSRARSMRRAVDRLHARASRGDAARRRRSSAARRIAMRQRHVARR